MNRPNAPKRPAKPRHEPPSQAEFGQLRAACARLGMTGAEISQVLDGAPAGRNREQLAAALREWLRTRPKGQG